MLRKTHLLCVLAIALVAHLLAADPLKDVLTIPASNPYRSALVHFAGLAAEDRTAIDNWLSPPDESVPPPILTAEQKLIVRDLTAAVVANAASPATTAADWAPTPDPTDPDNPVNAWIPTVGPIRNLARIATKAAETLPPSEAVTAYAAVAQLGRQQRAGSTLIQQLTGVAIEAIALSGAAKDLTRFSPAELKQLSTAWNGLQPHPSIETALAGERETFFKPFVERTILPALRDLLAEESDDNPDAPAASPQNDSERTFTRDLRLSGLLDLGDGERRILLENASTQATITLRENVATEGITLTGIDFEKRRAYIRHEDQEAVIHLQSKRIVERSRAAADLRATFGILDTQDPDQAKALRAWLDKIRAYPDGVDGYARDLLAAYQTIIDDQIAAASQAKDSPDTATPPSDDPLLRTLMPTFGTVARTLQNSRTQSTMLQAAIQLRLRDLGQADATPPADPWAEDGAGFAVEKTPDGGFLLRSRYEARPDKPLTYKFAAPDAGFIRQP